MKKYDCLIAAEYVAFVRTLYFTFALFGPYHPSQHDSALRNTEVSLKFSVPRENAATRPIMTSSLLVEIPKKKGEES